MRPCQEKVLTLLEQNTLCQKDAAGGERVERKRVGDNGKGKRGSEVPTFLLFPPSNARLLFFLSLLFSLEYPARASAEEKEQNM